MVITSIGVNFSTVFHSVLAGMTCLLLIFITVLGFFYADTNNWFNDDNGGFFPYGVEGVLRASSAGYYAFTGYEIIAMSSEEAKNPAKTVPQSITLTIVLVTILYMGVSVSFTLMVPYNVVNIEAPFPAAFQYHSVYWAKYLIAVGTVVTLSNLCALSLFGVQRLGYSMSKDGLLLKCFSTVNERTKVPLRPVLAFGPIVIVLILTVDLSNSIGFMVIYGFVQSSFFAAYMIVLRYEPSSLSTTNQKLPTTSLDETDACIYVENQPIYTDAETETRQLEHNHDNTNSLHNTITPNGYTKPRSTYESIRDSIGVKRCVLVITIACFLLALQLVKGSSDLVAGNAIALSSTNALVIIITVLTWTIWTMEQRGEKNGYLVPLMPFLPVTCLFANMLMLVSIAERGLVIAAVVCSGAGMVVYFLIVIYGLMTGRENIAKFSGEVRLLQDQESTEDEGLDVEYRRVEY